MVYPFSDYEVSGSTTTKNIVVDGQLAATIDTHGSTTNTYNVYENHLGSVSKVTDDSAAMIQSLGYAPYGAVTSDIQTGSYNSQNQYIGQKYDPESSLSYLNARYYDSGRGQFTSQDPVFLGDPSQQNLADPQSLNSYSYAEDNPITKKDPTGRFDTPLDAVLTVGFLAYDAYRVTQSGFTTENKANLALDATGFVPFVPAGWIRGVKIADEAKNVAEVSAKGADVARGMDSAAQTSALTEKSVIHGNSLDSPKLNYLYQLVDRKSGQILKFGITSRDNPLYRYTQAQYDAMNAQMEILNTGSRREMHAAETQQIKNFEFENGVRPQLNKTYH